MAEAHESYSKDFEASCVEADTMVNAGAGPAGPDRRAADRRRIRRLHHQPGGERSTRRNSPRRWANVTPPKRESFRRFTFVMLRGAHIGWIRASKHSGSRNSATVVDLAQNRFCCGSVSCITQSAIGRTLRAGLTIPASSWCQSCISSRAFLARIGDIDPDYLQQDALVVGRAVFT